MYCGFFSDQCFICLSVEARYRKPRTLHCYKRRFYRASTSILKEYFVSIVVMLTADGFFFGVTEVTGPCLKKDMKFRKGHRVSISVCTLPLADAEEVFVSRGSRLCRAPHETPTASVTSFSLALMSERLVLSQGNTAEGTGCSPCPGDHVCSFVFLPEVPVLKERRGWFQSLHSEHHIMEIHVPSVLSTKFCFLITKREARSN